MAGFKYRAFISYSHADHKWGVWLHKKLEAFRTPKPLVGRETSAGPVPRRLGRVYRDEAEEGAAHDLGERIERALSSSDALVVICSPKSARSKWVNQEIIRFKQLGREARIFPVIVAGEPHADDPSKECFPDALKFKLGPDGELSEEPADPLAVDIRKFGREDTALRLVAGILNVDYDDLKQRELQRARARNRIYASLATGAMLLAIFAVGGALIAYAAARIAEERARTALIAQSNFLADAADEAVSAGNGLLAALLARKALPVSVKAMDRPYVHAAEAALISAMQKNRLEALFVHSGPIRAMTFLRGGKQFATVQEDGYVRIFSVKGEVLISETATGTRAIGIVSLSGDRLAIGAEDGQLLVLSAADLSVIKRIPAYNVAISRMTASADGKSMVTVGNDGVAKIWNTESYSIVASIKEAAKLTAPSISPDSAAAAVSTKQGLAIVSLADGSLIRLIPGRATWSAHCFSPDSRSIAYAMGFSGDVFLQDLRAEAPPSSFIGHRSAILSINFSPDGRFLLTASADREARVWDLHSASALMTLTGHDALVSNARYSTNGSLIATWSLSKGSEIRIWSGYDIRTNPAYEVLAGHEMSITDARFIPGSSKLLSISRDGTARIWNLEQQFANKSEQRMQDSLHIERASADLSSIYASNSNDDAFFLRKTSAAAGWAKTGARLKLPPADSETGIQSVISAFSRNGRVAAASDGVSVHVFDLDLDKRLATITENGSAVTAAAVSPDGRLAAAGFENGALKTVDLSSPDHARATHFEEGVERIVFAKPAASEQGGVVVAAGRRLSLLDGDGREVWSSTFDKPISFIVPSHRADMLLVGEKFGGYSVLRTKDGKVEYKKAAESELADPWTSARAWSSDDRMFAVRPVLGGPVRVIDAASGETLASLAEEPGFDFQSFAFTGDDRYLVASVRNEIRAIDVATGREALRTPPSSVEYASVSSSADGIMYLGVRSVPDEIYPEFVKFSHKQIVAGEWRSPALCGRLLVEADDMLDDFPQLTSEERRRFHLEETTPLPTSGLSAVYTRIVEPIMRFAAQKSDTTC